MMDDTKKLIILADLVSEKIWGGERGWETDWNAFIDAAKAALSPVLPDDVQDVTYRLREYFKYPVCREAANLIERLARSAEYWKAEHLAGNKRIEELEDWHSHQLEERKKLERQRDEALKVLEEIWRGEFIPLKSSLCNAAQFYAKSEAARIRGMSDEE